MTEPKWFTYEAAIAGHSLQLRRFGGAPGLRDERPLRSALERPCNKWRYEGAELPELAAAYAFGLIKNHAFVDGKLAFISMVAFPRMNRIAFKPDQAGMRKIKWDGEAVDPSRIEPLL